MVTVAWASMTSRFSTTKMLSAGLKRNTGLVKFPSAASIHLNRIFAVNKSSLANKKSAEILEGALDMIEDDSGGSRSWDVVLALNDLEMAYLNLGGWYSC